MRLHTPAGLVKRSSCSQVTGALLRMTVRSLGQVGVPNAQTFEAVEKRGGGVAGLGKGLAQELIEVSLSRLPCSRC